MVRALEDRERREREKERENETRGVAQGPEGSR